MLYRTEQGRALVVEVSRQIVDQIAPEEADLFDELLAEYDAGHLRVQTGAEPAETDDPLGFGIGEALPLVTPAVVAAVSGVLTYMAQQALETAKMEGAAIIRARVAAMLRLAIRNRPSAEDTSLQLSREQLRELRKLAEQKGEEFGMPVSDAARMADALIGVLVLA